MPLLLHLTQMLNAILNVIVFDDVTEPHRLGYMSNLILKLWPINTTRTTLCTMKKLILFIWLLTSICFVLFSIEVKNSIKFHYEYTFCGQL